MKRILLVLLLLTPVACQRKSTAEGRLASIEINRPSLRKVTGRWKPPTGPEVDYSAYFQQMELQLIEESIAPQHWMRYYFVEGNLFYFRELKAGEIERQFVVDRKAQVVNTRPTPFPVADYEIMVVRTTQLKEQVMARAGQMFVFPLMRNR